MAMATNEIEQVTTLIKRNTQEINARWSRANTRIYTKFEGLEERVAAAESKTRTLSLLLLLATASLVAMILIVATAI